MSKSQVNLQDNFLNIARKEEMMLTVFLINGYQIKGTVKRFDNFTILINVENKQQLVYKHAISAIIPYRNLNMVQTAE